MRWPFAGRRERLRREAADWVARLNRPDGELHRAAFERWYRASEEHAAAYDRLAALFEVAGGASRPPAAAADVAPERKALFHGPGRYALAAAVAIVALLTCVLVFARGTVSGPQVETQVASFAASAEDARTVVLADGSQVLLSPRSALEVALGADERRLRLVRGEARFSVAHETRPFVVSAGGAEVVARGTRFVVTLAGGRATIALLEGRVDVSYAPSAGGADRRRVARLQPGQRLVVEPPARVSTAPREEPSAGRHAPASSMIEFDDTPLGEAVETVNRNGGSAIRLGEPALSRLRITGAFRRGDAAGFADSVAAAFGLEVDRRPDGTIWLTPRPQPRRSE
jgi:transmembrane sensor